MLQSVILLDPIKRDSMQDKEVVDQFLPYLNRAEIDAILEEWRLLCLSTDLPTCDCEVDQWWLKVLEQKSSAGSPLYGIIYLRQQCPLALTVVMRLCRAPRKESLTTSSQESCCLRCKGYERLDSSLR